MNSLSSRAVVTAIASLLLVGSAYAQTPAPAAPAEKADTKTAPADKKTAAPRTAASLECSKEADDKGLKGKERKKFRAECKKEAKSKAM
jgi:psiF repeat